MTTSDLQTKLHEWRKKNFPDADAEQQLLGVVEEVGELAHAVLKRKQGIRGTEGMHAISEFDAIGDILVYLAGFCSYRDISLDECFEIVAEGVMKRDWIRFPFDGLTE